MTYRDGRRDVWYARFSRILVRFHETSSFRSAQFCWSGFCRKKSLGKRGYSRGQNIPQNIMDARSGSLRRSSFCQGLSETGHCWAFVAEGLEHYNCRQFLSSGFESVLFSQGEQNGSGTVTCVIFSLLALGLRGASVSRTGCSSGATRSSL